jgi:outer membrane protein OmpA-like peptidoglycan-associated protein
VICVETGQTFGSILWGYTKNSSGVITLTCGQVKDVSTTSASTGLESVRKAFYSGYFQQNLSDFGRGSSVLTPAHKSALSGIAATGSVRRILLVGANDNSGGAESNADLSMARANTARDYLVNNLKVDASLIQVEGHGVEAREPNPPGAQVPANRRVDIHLDRGLVGGTSFQTGSAKEEFRLRRQDPRLTYNELIETLLEFQKRLHLSVAECRQMQNMADALRRWHRLDPSVPDVNTLYGPLISSLRSRCESEIPKETPQFPLPELKPPSFLPKIEEATKKPPF